MNLFDFFQNVGVGGSVALVVVLLSLVEIAPIKISPLQWIGRRINKEVFDSVEKIDAKLNAHIVESYRTSILDFADKVMGGQIYTIDKWRQMLNMCASYEEMIEQNHLVNGQATAAIVYIKKEYQRCAGAGRFAGFPQN